jgi:hypothetical protein
MAKTKYSKAIALSKEPFRLWYEFLKRANAKGMKVHKDYAEWGDTSVSFKKWWEQHGSGLISVVANGVELATDQTIGDENYYLFAIPKHLSARQTRVEAESLMKRLKEKDGQVKLNTRWRITEGTSLRPESYRAYIKALDCRDQLVKQAISEGKSEKDIKAVHVLAALRLYYIKKHERYKGKGDLMPQRLTHGDGGYETDASKIVTDHSDPRVATDSVNAVREYLKKAEATLQNVAKGFFP